MNINFFLFSGVVPIVIIFITLWFYRPFTLKQVAKAFAVSVIPLFGYLLLVVFLEDFESLNLGWSTYTLVFFLIPYVIIVLILNVVAWVTRKGSRDNLM